MIYFERLHKSVSYLVSKYFYYFYSFDSVFSECDWHFSDVFMTINDF